MKQNQMFRIDWIGGIISMYQRVFLSKRISMYGVAEV